MDVEYFHCSSDPNSLDGIIINDLKIALIDGTAPHTLEPKYAGAVEMIINIGDFFDEKRLILQKNEISGIIQ